VSKNVFLTLTNMCYLYVLQLGLSTFCTIRHNAFWNVEIIVLTILYSLFLSLVSTYLKCTCVLLGSVGFILGFISTVYIV